jgi:hypothetical protein
MRQTLFTGAVALALWACGGDGGTGPSVDITGTFIGDFTSSLTPGAMYQETLQLTQSGSNVSGTLTTNTGRSGTVSGSVSGTRLTATVTLTDVCGGSSETTADITDNATRLTGNYAADDCFGSYTGGFVLDKQ